MRTLRNPVGGRVTVGSRVQTPRGLLVMLGRAVLWVVIGLVLVRGAGDVLGGHGRARTPHRIVAAAGAGWPGDGARALAVEFATAYLTHASGEDATAYARRLTGLASAEVADALVPRFDRRAPAQLVRLATVAATTRLDARRALVTVAVSVATSRGMGTRRLVVPIARDRAGGLVVYDLPSFAAAPARAQAPPDDAQPLVGADHAAIEDVLTRFLRAYLAGDAADLAYLVPPGTRIGAASARFGLLSVASVESLGGVSGRRRVVLVTVHARDLGSRALYMLRYRVGLERRDRWYVADLDGSGSR